jgi:hypothetical protein
MSAQDRTNQFSDGQALTTTADSTDNVDFGAGIDHLGNATTLDLGESARHSWLNVTVVTAFAGGTSVQIALQDSADDSSFAATNPVIATPAVAAATLVAGYVVMRLPLPPDLRRYLKLVYTIVGTFTAGAVDAWIGPAGQGPAKSSAVSP